MKRFSRSTVAALALSAAMIGGATTPAIAAEAPKDDSFFAGLAFMSSETDANGNTIPSPDKVKDFIKMISDILRTLESLTSLAGKANNLFG
ncbi:hypothetical protein N7326_00935 [Corynebacterium sp. ES2794-CONJ1]|uniref:hypothetical protein n=1 Tax=unclassified Corynebacterium TaxID=2624378 RepID=UPI0021685C9E|nr:MULTISPECIES: hypothetical protein [unclassified Corynebacterium]MCS4489234.1 hypothetical protein [Corynebacterium sp. ES2775-CONJ]MCS4491047.1 hypothetical protein [Corynebacterium sp. ES2715-CONJ3]MCS4531072.1 hypothetical protein [Corynebacterium sp. ES2730-CONJ]MCU9518439.1 hypothetical protein [Corynebacterium sp. ES2794-CONJ1]